MGDSNRFTPGRTGHAGHRQNAPVKTFIRRPGHAVIAAQRKIEFADAARRRKLRKEHKESPINARAVVLSAFVALRRSGTVAAGVAPPACPCSTTTEGERGPPARERRHAARSSAGTSWAAPRSPRHNPRSQRIAAELSNGATFGVSISYIVASWSEHANAKTGRREKVAERFTLIEASLVVVPADPHAGIQEP